MAEQFFMDTFARTGVVIKKGKGSTFVDESGKKYIDFTAGIAVSSLGHAHPGLSRAIARQAAKLIHVSNYFETEQARRFARRLCKAAGMARVFLANSGAEANEGMIKLIRKWSNDAYGGSRPTIVCLQDSFHGRTITTLAATGQDKFHKHFGPFTPGFIHVPRGDFAALRAAADRGDVCAFLFEPIQGEGGVNLLSPEYLKDAAALAKEKGILMAFDEIQTGIGRCGSFLACRGLGVEPDLVSLAKGIAGGLPCGAFLCSQRLAGVLGPGDHGTTFGGGPLAAAAGNAVLDVVTAKGFMEEVRRKGVLMMETVKAWNHPLVTEVRGQGLMIGIDVSIDPHAVMETALKRGLAVLTAGQSVVRIVPSLLISEKKMARGLAILKAVLDDLSNGGGTAHG